MPEVQRVFGRLFPSWPPETEHRHAGLERGGFQPQPIRGAAGPANPPASAVQDGANVLLLDVRQLGAAASRQR